MASLDQIVDRVREEAGADFAFILTRRGRLATRNAPQEMPEDGRTALVELAEELLGSKREFAHTELPRQSLVPYGGAAPVDVYVAARDEAILCVVMATYVSQDSVGPAVAQGVHDLDALLDTDQRRLRRRGLKAKPPNPKSSSGGKRRRTGEFSLDFDDEGAPSRGTIPFLTPYRAAPKVIEPAPEITVGEARVGHVTLAAIEIDAEGPEIAYGMAPIGRHTIAEIERSVVPEGDPKSSIPDIRVNVVTMPEIDPKELDLIDRQTLPFTENASAAKRSFEAKAQPKSEHAVTVSSTAQRTVIVGKSGSSRSRKSMVDARADESRASRVDVDDTIPDAPAPRALRRPPAPAEADDPVIETSPMATSTPDAAVLKALRDSNIELWHQALGEIELDPRAIDPKLLAKSAAAAAKEAARESARPPQSAAEPAKDASKPRTRPPAASFPKRKTTAPPPKRRD